MDVSSLHSQEESCLGQRRPPFLPRCAFDDVVQRCWGWMLFLLELLRLVGSQSLPLPHEIWQDRRVQFSVILLWLVPCIEVYRETQRWFHHRLHKLHWFLRQGHSGRSDVVLAGAMCELLQWLWINWFSSD